MYAETYRFVKLKDYVVNCFYISFNRNIGNSFYLMVMIMIKGNLAIFHFIITY